MNDLIFENGDDLRWESENISELIDNEYYDNMYPDSDNSIALKNLLNGDAQGTKEKDYLDPTPFINKKGINYLAARADEIKVGIDNMDYTGQDKENESDILTTIFNLLMPRYARRVEVEDLNKNFWVIAQTIDAILSAIWGHDGIIDIIQEIIKRQNNLYLKINDIDYTVKSLDQTICLLRPNFSSYFDDGTYFDLNGDGLIGQDDMSLLLAIGADFGASNFDLLKEKVDDFVDKYLVETEQDFCQQNPDTEETFVGEWGIRDYNNEKEFNSTIRKRTNFDQLRISSGKSLCFIRPSGENFCCGLYAPGYKEVNLDLSFDDAKEKVKEILLHKVIQLSKFFELNANTVSIIKIKIDNFPIENYPNQTEKIQYNYEKFRDFGFLYEDIISKESDISLSPQKFGEKLIHFFYHDLKDNTVNEGGYAWERCVYTSGYNYTEGVIKNSWITIPHVCAYQPRRDNVKMLVAAFSNFDVFFNFIKEEDKREERISILRQLLLNTEKRIPYILFSEESYKNEEIKGLAFLTEMEMNSFVEILLNEIDILSSEDFYQKYVDQYLTVGSSNREFPAANIKVTYWGGIEKNNYFEIMRIMSRRIHFNIADDLKTANIQNYCYPTEGNEGENYYLRYDIRRIAIYYWCDDFRITKCKNYFGPFRLDNIARFRGEYYYTLNPFFVENDLCKEEEKIYINRVHTARHNEEDEWTQCSEFYTVQSKIDEKLSGNLGSPHCADITDNYIVGTNWENPALLSVCKINFRGHEPGITYTTEIEKTWFLNEDEEDNLESVFIEGSNLAW